MLRQYLNRSALLALSILLALAILTPFAAPAAAQPGCTFVPDTSAAVYAAPLANPAQRSGTLSAGPYTVTARSGLTYDVLYHVQIDAATSGWVDPQSGTLNGTCDGLPVDERPLTEYPSICTITSDQGLAFYNDAALTTPKPSDLSPGQYVITRQAERAYFVRLDHAMGGWIPKGDGSLSPACALVLHDGTQTATAEANARVWSAPTVRAGERLYTLPEGARVTVIAGPARGPIQYGSDLQGDWYEIAQNGVTVGWVWAERLTLHDPAPPDGRATATALDNARLWSLPDVHSGSQLGSLPPGSRLIVLDGPVRGPIRYDTPATGDWYRMEVMGSGVTGWLWAGRLALD